MVDIKKYSKSILAAIAAGGYAFQAAISDDVITSAERVGIMLAVATALGVFAAPNQQKSSKAGE